MYPYLAKGRNAHTWFSGKWLVYWDVCLTGSIEQEEIFFCFNTVYRYFRIHCSHGKKYAVGKPKIALRLEFM